MVDLIFSLLSATILMIACLLLYYLIAWLYKLFRELMCKTTHLFLAIHSLSDG